MMVSIIESIEREEENKIQRSKLASPSPKIDKNLEKLGHEAVLTVKITRT